MTAPFGNGINTSDQPWSIANWFVQGGDGSVSGLANRTQDNVTGALQDNVKGSPGWGAASGLVYSGLRAGISLPLAIIEAIVNRLFGTSIDFTDMGTVLDAIQLVPGATQIIEIIKSVTGIDLNTIFDGIDLTNPGAVLTAIETAVGTAIGAVVNGPLAIAQAEIAAVVNTVTTILESLGLLPALMDAIYNVTGGGNATGVTLGQVISQLQALTTNVETALNTANAAIGAVQQFGGLLHQLVQDLGTLPDYLGLDDFVAQIGAVVAAVWGNIVTSLSPSNPGTAANSAQIAAIQSSLVAGMAGISASFPFGTSLSANYPGTSNPAWTAVTGYSLCTVQSGGYLQDAVPHAMVFTGNPEASATDHGLITDKVIVEAVITNLQAGTSGIFICGHGTTGLAQNVLLALNIQPFGHQLTIYTCTGPLSGLTQRTAITSGTLGRAFQNNDLIGIAYDNAGDFTMYVNGDAIGTPWPDTGAVVAHGAGFRECGIVTATDGFGGIAGPGLSLFNARDYA